MTESQEEREVHRVNMTAKGFEGKSEDGDIIFILRLVILTIFM